VVIQFYDKNLCIIRNSADPYFWIASTPQGTKPSQVKSTVSSTASSLTFEQPMKEKNSAIKTDEIVCIIGILFMIAPSMVPRTRVPQFVLYRVICKIIKIQICRWYSNLAQTCDIIKTGCQVNIILNIISGKFLGLAVTLI